MVFKLIFLIVDILLIAFFSGFNIENKSNVWFFWTTFKDIPVFITVLVSFAAGIIASLIVFLSVKTSKALRKDKNKEKAEDKPEEKKENKKRQGLLAKIQNSAKKAEKAEKAESENAQVKASDNE